MRLGVYLSGIYQSLEELEESPGLCMVRDELIKT